LRSNRHPPSTPPSSSSQRSVARPDLYPFPTRRSSDLRAVLEEVLAHRSTIVFTNSRSQAERLTGKLNRLHARRVTTEAAAGPDRSEEHTSELQSRENLVCRLLLEKKNIHARIGLLLVA